MNKLLINYINLILEGGATAERQERGIIQSINKIASYKNPITVMSNGASIDGVIGANKMPDLNELGQEQYTDVVLTLQNNKKINISAKGSSAPSLAGGGLVALQILVPDIIERFLTKARDALAKNYNDGQVGAPDIFGRITDEDSKKILRGNKQMGGPIHYMYQGPMDVKAVFNKDSVTLDGTLTRVDEYAKAHDLYLRARKRRIDQPVDLHSVDNNGYPLLFGKSPSRGDSGRRIVIAGRPSKNSILIDI